MRKKILAAGMVSVMLAAALCGCDKSDNAKNNTENNTGGNIEQADNNKEGNSQTNNTTAAKFDIKAEHVEENEQTVAVKKDGKLSGEGADVTVEAAENNLITFEESSVNSKAAGVNVKDGTATISSSGTYVVTGTAKNGQIIVDTEDKGTVWIIFADADITNTVNSPVYIKNAKKTIISAAAGTENTLTDAQEYTYDNETDEEPSACIFSKDDLVISGNGKLTINGNFNNGIASKDTLEINDTNLTVTAKNNGIKGKDYLIIRSGDIEVNALGDGLKSDNTSDSKLGYILIENGNINITSGEDGIQAETCMKITGGEINITTGDGAKTTSTGNMWGGGNTASDTSIKGIKAGVDITVTGGNITVNSEDDAIHTNSSIQIDGGRFNIASGDDGIHADTKLEINGGEIDITQSYEGIESLDITINDGDIKIAASDDGINAAGGNDGSSMGGRPGMNSFSASTGSVSINGGDIYVNAYGDGLDSNGSVTMTGGEVYIDGPENDGNGALDYDSTFNMTGGILVAAGSSGMLQTVSQSSSQNCITVVTSSYKNGGTEFVLKNSSEAEVISYTPSKRYNSIIVCTPDIKSGEKYTAYFDGNAEGSVEVTSVLSSIGNAGGFGGNGNFGGNGGFGGGHGGRRDSDFSGNEMPDMGEAPSDFNGDMPDMKEQPSGFNENMPDMREQPSGFDENMPDMREQPSGFDENMPDMRKQPGDINEDRQNINESPRDFNG